MRKSKVHSNFYFFILVIAIVVACDSSRVYEDYVDFDEGFWHIDSVQRFRFDIDDASREYNLFATFRNTSTYPYYNLYYNYTLIDSSGNILKNELKEIDLFDPKTGKPFGDGLGDLFDHKMLLDQYLFESVGKYEIQLQQFMRMDTLPFLVSVGARVELDENQN